MSLLCQSTDLCFWSHCALDCFTARHTTFTLYLWCFGLFYCQTSTFTLYLWCFGLFYCQTYNIHPLPVVLWTVLLPDIQHSPFTCGALDCFTARHTTFTLYLWCFGMFYCQTYNIHPLPVVLWDVLLPDIQHSPFTCGALGCFTARHTTFTLYLWCFGMFYCQTYNIHPLPVVLWTVLLPDIQHSPFTCGALGCFTARHTTFTLYLWCFGMFYCQTYNIHPLPVVLWDVLLPDIQHSPFTCGALDCFTARHTTFTLYLWCFGPFYCQTYNIHPLPVVLWDVSAFSLFFVCSPDLANIYCGMQHRVSKIITNCSLMIVYNTFTECVHSLLTMYETFKDKNTTPY